jgi:hypothetical protein
MKIKRSTLALASLLLSLPPAALAAGKNTFDFFVWGKLVGNTTYTLADSKGDIKVSSSVDRHDYPVPMTEEFRIGSDGLVRSGLVTRVNDHAIIVYKPEKQNSTLEVLPTRNGDPQTTAVWNLPRPDFLIGLMEDAATWQLLTDTATAHPHPDNIYPLLIVGENNFTPDRLEMGHLSPPVPAKGTLDGRPIDLRHYVFTLSKGPVDLYVDAQGTLMQAEVAGYGYKHVRTNFTLTN